MKQTAIGFASLVVILLLLAKPTPTSAAFGETRTLFSRLYAGDGGPATEAYFDFPEDLFITSDGTIWVADTFNNVVRKIDPNGSVSTYAGTGAYGLKNGSRGVAQFGFPQGIAVTNDTVIYLSDTDSNIVRKIDADGNVSPLVGDLSAPQGLALKGDSLFIADTGANAIKKFTLSSGSLTTLTTEIKAPRKIVLSADGHTLYAVDSGNYRVVKINTSTGTVTTIAGDATKGYQEGVGTAAQFYDPAGIGLDPETNTLYVGDIDADRIAMIRKIDLTTNTTSRWVYDSAMTSVNERSSMRVHAGYLYLAGTGNIHRYKLSDPAVNNDVGGKERYMLREGSLSQALLSRPGRMIFSKDRQWVYVSGAHKLLRVNLTTNQLHYIIGSSVDNYVEGTGTKSRFSGVAGMAVNAVNDTLYVADRFNNRLRRIDIAAQTSYHLSGTGEINSTGPGNGYVEGSKDTAKFSVPVDVVLSPDEQYLYLTDSGNHRIRRVEVATGATSLIAGSSAGFKDGTGSAAQFNAPFGLALDAAGANLYVADRNNHAIRRVRLSDGQVTTIAGSGKAGYRDAVGDKAVLNLPSYLSLDGDRLYFTDGGSHRIRLLELGSQVVKLVAGDGKRGYQDGPRTDARFNNLSGLLADTANERLWVADTWNDLIRTVEVSGEAPFTDPAPKVSRVEPATVPQGDAVARIAVRGSGFKHGAQVVFGDVTVKSFVESSTKIAVIVPIAKMEPGWYDVRVTHLDGQSSTQAAAFGLARKDKTVPNEFFTTPSEKGILLAPSTVRSGLSVAAADLDGNGTQEYVAAPGPGTKPSLRILGIDGKLVRTISAFPASQKSGLNLSVGDLTGDGSPEIVAAPQEGSGEVRVFSPTGKLLNRFQPFGPKAKHGVSLAIGDVTGDGQPDLIAGQASRGSTVVILDAQGMKIGSFPAFGKSRVGVSLAVVDLNGDGAAEILAVPRRGRVTLAVFDAVSRRRSSPITAFPASIKTGATIAAGDVTGDGQPEIILGLRPGGKSTVRIFSAALKLLKQFDAFSRGYKGGVGVAVGAVTGDGIGKVIASRLTGRGEVVIFTAAGRAVKP